MRSGAGNGSASSVKPEDVAIYVAALTSELTELAREAKLGALAYFLDMARHEAQAIVGKRDPADGSSGR